MAKRGAAAARESEVVPLSAAAQRRAVAREAIVAATRALARKEGFRGAHMSLIAARASIGVGLIYKHFPSQADLFAEVYRRVVTRELSVIETAIAVGAGGPLSRLEIAVRTFCTRAIRAGRFAHAIMVEPVDEVLDEHRLVFREGYRVLFARLLDEAIERGELAKQNTETSAAAVLGIITETLVRPLGDPSQSPPEGIVDQVVELCLSAVIGRASAPSPSRARSKRGRRLPRKSSS